MRPGGKMKMRSMNSGGPKGGGKVAFPNQNLPSNPVGDKQAKLLFMAVLTLSVVLCIMGITWCAAQVYYGVINANWLGIAVGAVGIGVLVMFARSAVWLSIFAALMFAQKSNAWEAQQFLCDRAMKLKRIIPGGATTAALLLIQGYISRGQLEETIKIGQEQYEEFGNDKNQQQNLAPMYSTLGLAFHMQGQWRDSITWNDRAIEAFAKVLEQMKEKKGFVAKLAGAGGQSQEWIKNIHTQLAVTYFNNGTNQFNLRNHRAAKEAYKHAMDHANQAPDFPEKADLLKVSKEQMQRLKHS
jgi:tetratricopeptide (TPR) repeat protein